MQNSVQDHYEVLGLHFSLSKTENLTQQELKLAYRRALLLHHPDKSTLSTINTAGYTVDQITTAYKTIADPVARGEYHKSRVLAQHIDKLSAKSLHRDFEAVDLDDLDFDEQNSVWYRNCRCGKDKAFVVTEKILEQYAKEGEVVAGCQGCSLWLRIMFVEADDQ